jgi:hypothetical protein
MEEFGIHKGYHKNSPVCPQPNCDRLSGKRGRNKESLTRKRLIRLPWRYGGNGSFPYAGDFPVQVPGLPFPNDS